MSRARFLDAQTTLVVNDGVLKVDGEVSLANVHQLREQGDKLLAQVDTIDLSFAQCVDSSALLLILAWTRLAKTFDQSIQLHGIPAQLFAVAEVYGIKDLLPAQASL